MSKEALKKIGSTTYYDWSNIPLSEHFKEEFEMIKKSLTELEELKRYPTSEEVCKALSEHMKREVYCEDGFFVYRKEEQYNQPFIIVYQYKNKKLIDFIKALPPHLITLIGRFYEGLEHENTSS